MADDTELPDPVLGLLLASAIPGGLEAVAAACDERPGLADRLEGAAESRPELLSHVWAQVHAERARRAIDAVQIGPKVAQTGG